MNLLELKHDSLIINLDMLVAVEKGPNDIVTLILASVEPDPINKRTPPYTVDITKETWDKIQKQYLPVKKLM